MEKVIFCTIGFLMVIATVVPILKIQYWWVRVFDFPRIQIIILFFIAISGYWFLVEDYNNFDVSVNCFFLSCLLYQLLWVLPYTSLYKKQVLKAKKSDEKNMISIFFSNVLMTNRNASKLIALIREANPDMVLTVETDKWWEKELDAIMDTYPNKIGQPIANTYGMLLYSRLPFEKEEIKFLLDQGIPSIHTFIKLPSGKTIKFFGVHPKPPVPGESNSSKHRDAELVIVGKEASKLNYPVIIAGDLNDVAWSHTTRLFQKISNLLDPRIGRGFFSTFNAKSYIFRWPLDHVFHSKEFRLVELKRCKPYGSDHFPIFIKLSYEPESGHEQKEKQAGESEMKEAKKVEEKGRKSQE